MKNEKNENDAKSTMTQLKALLNLTPKSVLEKVKATVLTPDQRQTLLQAALNNGNWDVSRYLIEEGAVVILPIKDEARAWTYRDGLGDKCSTKDITTDSYGQSLLILATKGADEDMVSRFIRAGVTITKEDWTYADPDFTTALILVANYRDGDFVPPADLKYGFPWAFIRRPAAWWMKQDLADLSRFLAAVKENPTCPTEVKKRLEA